MLPLFLRASLVSVKQALLRSFVIRSAISLFACSRAESDTSDISSTAGTRAIAVNTHLTRLSLSSSDVAPRRHSDSSSVYSSAIVSGESVRSPRIRSAFKSALDLALWVFLVGISRVPLMGLCRIVNIFCVGDPTTGHGDHDPQK
jgi:hypothetical protein